MLAAINMSRLRQHLHAWCMKHGFLPLLTYLVFGILQGSFAEVRTQFVHVVNLELATSIKATEAWLCRGSALENTSESIGLRNHYGPVGNLSGNNYTCTHTSLLPIAVQGLTEFSNPLSQKYFTTSISPFKV